VEECLRCIDGVDLEEAYEWVSIYAPPGLVAVLTFEFGVALYSLF
jgi:hypothetical protein